LVLTPLLFFLLSLCFVFDTVDIINIFFTTSTTSNCSPGPFGTNPQYGMDYWPKNASLIQVDCDASKLGRVKPLKRSDVGVAGDAALAAK
jgi:hypothetical protein